MSMMEMQRVKSGNLWATGYDPASSALRITFTREDKKQKRNYPGKTYEYFGVPQDVAAELASASSPGKFFAASIKGKFNFKVCDDQPYPETDFEEITA